MPNSKKQDVVVTPLLAMSATAHNSLEKLSIRIAELDQDGAAIRDEDFAALLAHLDAAQASASGCADIVRRMARNATDPEPPVQDAGSTSSEPASLDNGATPEDDMFPVGDVHDYVTGLPGRPIAIKALESALAIGRPRYAGIYCIDRLRYLASRFGTTAGQQAIHCYAAHLRQKAPQQSMLFRWGGSSFLSLIDLSGSVSDARALFDHVCGQRVKFNFESEQRSALLNLSAECLVHSMHSAADIDELITSFDAFAGEHSRKQPD